MNEIIKAIKQRRSIRKFKPEMPKRDDSDAIIEAGLYAPSGMNKQSSIIIAVTNKNLRDKISRDNCKIGGWDENFDPCNRLYRWRNPERSRTKTRTSFFTRNNYIARPSCFND